MNDYRTAIAIGKALRANSAFTGVFIYAHDREIDASGNDVELTGELVDGVMQPQVRLPHVAIQVSGQSLCGSATIGKMKAEITNAAQADDEKAAVHSARDTALRAVMANPVTLAAAFASAGVNLLGKACLVSNAPDVQTRAFVTPHTYVLGVEAI